MSRWQIMEMKQILYGLVFAMGFPIDDILILKQAISLAIMCVSIKEAFYFQNGNSHIPF